MPARVRLFPSPSSLKNAANKIHDSGAKTLTPQMLEWPIRTDERGQYHDRDIENSLREFLGALLELEPFSFAFSLVVNTQGHFLRRTSVEWGGMYFGDRSVHEFYGHSLSDPFLYRPFVCFLRWPCVDTQLVQQWDKVRWKKFFCDLAYQKMMERKDQAETLIKNQQAIIEHCNEVLGALPI